MKTGTKTVPQETLPPPTHLTGYARIGTLMVQITPNRYQRPLRLRPDGVEPIVGEVNDYIKKLRTLQTLLPTDVIGIGNEDLIESVKAMLRYELRRLHSETSSWLDNPSIQIEVCNDWSLVGFPTSSTTVHHHVVAFSPGHKAKKRVL